MKRYLKFTIGLIVILSSTPLGYASVNALGRMKGNLSGEYIPLLYGFISSYLIVGILIFIWGLTESRR